jgi:hypothetical protein
MLKMVKKIIWSPVKFALIVYYALKDLLMELGTGGSHL